MLTCRTPLLPPQTQAEGVGVGAYVTLNLSITLNLRIPLLLHDAISFYQASGIMCLIKRSVALIPGPGVGCHGFFFGACESEGGP